MNIVGPLVSVYRFEIAGVTHDSILIQHAIASEEVAGVSGDGECVLGAVTFEDGDHFWAGMSLLYQPTDSQTGLQAKRDTGLHVDQLLLNELGGGKWAIKGMALLGVFERSVPTVFSCTHDTPRYAKASMIQALEYRGQTVTFFEYVVRINEYIVEGDVALRRSAQSYFTGDGANGNPGCIGVNQIAANGIVVIFGPN